MELLENFLGSHTKIEGDLFSNQVESYKMIVALPYFQICSSFEEILSFLTLTDVLKSHKISQKLLKILVRVLRGFSPLI